MIDGTVINNKRNNKALNDYWNFKDVKVFAGSGNGVAAADASYKNLVWENHGMGFSNIWFPVDRPPIVSLVYEYWEGHITSINCDKVDII